MQNVVDMAVVPKLLNLYGKKHFRIIPSVYPSINFFEDLVDPAEMELVWEIESLTNERLLEPIKNVPLVADEDRIVGPGSSVVMAAFTHIGKASRFTDGSYGVYCAGLAYETTIKETVYHREQFLRATKEPPLEITMRCYVGEIRKSLHNLKPAEFTRYHDSNDYSASQKLGKSLRSAKSWGLIYHSVRDEKGQCVALFRPPATSIPTPHSHLRYVWNGKKIVDVLDTKTVLSLG